MEITEVRINLVEGDEKLLAFATVTFDNCFVVRDLKVINGKRGYFVAMPSKRMKDGSFRDIAHPLNNETRKKLEERVIQEYEKVKGIEKGSEEAIEEASEKGIEEENVGNIAEVETND